MLLANDYCEELTGAISLDVVRMELLAETNEMRKRAYLLPRESMVHRLPMARNGEHAFAAYHEDESDYKLLFYDED